jgi:hypothetical protein
MNVLANAAVGAAYKNSFRKAFGGAAGDAGELSLPNPLEPSQWGAGMWIAVVVGGFLVYRFVTRHHR